MPRWNELLAMVNKLSERIFNGICWFMDIVGIHGGISFMDIVGIHGGISFMDIVGIHGGISFMDIVGIRGGISFMDIVGIRGGISFVDTVGWNRCKRLKCKKEKSQSILRYLVIIFVFLFFLHRNIS